MPVIGVDLVLKNIKNFGGGFTRHVNEVMKKVGKILDDEVTKNISLEDHSLEDLRRLGHPYRIGGPGLHDPKWQVHKQSGQMLRSKSSGVVPARFGSGQFRSSVYVAMDEGLEYNAHVIYGTSKMIPRDFLSGSLENIKEAAYRVLANNLRDAIMEFKIKHY